VRSKRRGRDRWLGAGGPNPVRSSFQAWGRRGGHAAPWLAAWVRAGDGAAVRCWTVTGRALTRQGDRLLGLRAVLSRAGNVQLGQDPSIMIETDLHPCVGPSQADHRVPRWAERLQRGPGRPPPRDDRTLVGRAVITLTHTTSCTPHLSLNSATPPLRLTHSPDATRPGPTAEDGDLETGSAGAPHRSTRDPSHPRGAAGAPSTAEKG